MERAMSKDMCCKIMKLDLIGEYDCALPQPWLDDMAAKAKELYGLENAYDILLSGTVWFYPEKPGNLFGFPMPITLPAQRLIYCLNEDLK